MKWCQNCVLPDTRPNLVFGPDGICNACRGSSRRSIVDFDARAKDFEAVVRSAKSRSGQGYDCLIPVSGGKDSTWQVATCLEAGLRVLAVTWRTPGRTAIGQENLENLISLGVDHVDYTISPYVESRFMLRTFERLGSPAVPMHLALFNIPLALAVRYRIPLVVWGENSAAEYGSPDDADIGFRLDRAWLHRYGVSGGTTAEDWEDEDLTAKDLVAYRGPTDEELDAAGVHAIFLGHFFPWDPEGTRAVAEQHGFRAAEEARTGLYAFADIDDDFISIHHWMKWPKFGFTRLFDNLSLEIRNGRMARDEAIAAIRAAGEQRPSADIARFCEFVGIDQERFDATVDRHRNDAVWRRRADGVWENPDFLIDNWEWT
jgi:N-acetyl sugar amidotransferase